MSSRRSAGRRSSAASAWRCSARSGTPRPRRAPSTTSSPTPTPRPTRIRERADGPKASNKWLTGSVADTCADVVSAAFDQAEDRDPDHERDWVVLVDGAEAQIAQIQAEALVRGVDIHIVCDLIHVLEYLWKAAWCFHDKAGPDIEAFVARHARTILAGNSEQTVADLRHAAKTAGTARRQDCHRCQDLHLPGEQTALAALRHRPGRRLADRHRDHRRRLPPPGQRPPGHHRGPLVPGRCRGSAETPGPDRQRRLRRLLGLPPPRRTPTHPPSPLPASTRPRSLNQDATRNRSGRTTGMPSRWSGRFCMSGATLRPTRSRPAHG